VLVSSRVRVPCGVRVFVLDKSNPLSYPYQFNPVP